MKYTYRFPNFQNKDHNSLPPPKQVSPGLPCGDVCDGLKVISKSKCFTVKLEIYNVC